MTNVLDRAQMMRFVETEGEQRGEVCYVDVNVFGRRAEVICQYLSKGSPLFVEGRLRFDSWQGQDGQQRSKLRVVVANFEFVGARREWLAGSEQIARLPQGPGADKLPSEPFQRRYTDGSSPTNETEFDFDNGVVSF